MKVLKFGGTSVGSAQRMKEVAKLITDGERKIVVLSAMSGTTNTLVEISDYLYKKNPEGANEIINRLETKYRQHIDELYATPEYKQKGLELIKSHFDYIRSYTKDLFTLFEEKVVLAQGELISTAMMNYYLQECGVKSVLLPALEYMRTDKNAEPDPVYIKDKLQVQLELHPNAEIYITQGFICRNAYGEVDNLQRGGSDYTASLIGAAVKASEIQIWTDIDGMHNNDPRVVDKTSPVRHLHFEEAAELAYFGAKILHPTCIQPAKYANIPVRLLNTMDPTAPGTLISNDTEKGKIKAVAAKENITATQLFNALGPVFGRDIYCGSVLFENQAEWLKLSSMQGQQYDVWGLVNVPLMINGHSYKLADFATVEKGQSPQKVAKENQQYRLCLQYEYIGSSEQGRKLLKKDLEAFNKILPMGYTAEDEQERWSWGKKDNAQYALLLIVIAIIFFTTGILFNSLKQPLAIIFVIPISYIGVFLTFYLFGLNFDQGGFASFVLLCGITVNASIYILNEYNSIRKRYPLLSDVQAYTKAWNSKIIPIFLTVVSTILGFIPFMIGQGKEAFWFPLAAGTIGGLIASILGIFMFLPIFSLKKQKKRMKSE